MSDSYLLLVLILVIIITIAFLVIFIIFIVLIILHPIVIAAIPLRIFLLLHVVLIEVKSAEQVLKVSLVLILKQSFEFLELSVKLGMDGLYLLDVVHLDLTYQVFFRNVVAMLSRLCNPV